MFRHFYRPSSYNTIHRNVKRPKHIAVIIHNKDNITLDGETKVEIFLEMQQQNCMVLSKIL
jgi:hypothetical protein